MTCPHGYSDGAYVLGALEPAQRSVYEGHLAGCPTCSAAVASLAAMPGLLGRVDSAALHHPDGPGPPPLPQLIEAASQRRRRQARARRWRLALAALAASVLAATGTAVWLDGSEPGAPAPAPAQAMRPVAESVPVTAQVAVDAAAAGTEVWMRCHYAGVPYDGAPRTFRLFAVGTDGSSEQLGSWRAAAGDEVELAGFSRFSAADLVRIELRGATGTVLLTYDIP